MAYNKFQNSMNNNRRLLPMVISKNNQILQDNNEYDPIKLMEQKYQLDSTQKQLQDFSSIDDKYSNLQSHTTPKINRHILGMMKPLRIIIIRHAERVDAVLGSDWSKKTFDRNGHYIRFSEHLPDALPIRSYLHHYVIDVPLTNRGRTHAVKTGKALLFNGYGVDICYTSPSLRCVQTADSILTGMNRKHVSLQLEPGLFECYLNDFKRTLCFMTKDELAANGYNIDKSYQSLMPFMRPHDNQLDYYERCRLIMNVITERHQTTGGTILIVAHAPSLEGLTRNLSGGKLQPEKLFDIARRVPFLAMTIVEKNNSDNPWLFRTKPLQTDITQSIHEKPVELAQQTTSISTAISHQPAIQQQQQQQLPSIKITPPQSQDEQQQRLQQSQNSRSRIPAGSFLGDPKKVVKSSTAPNLRTSNSLSDIFRVI